MTLDQIMKSVDQLSQEQRDELVRYIADGLRKLRPPRPQHTADEGMAIFEDIARKFRGDSID